MKRSQEDLLSVLKKQAGFLESSCKNFDSGTEDEALRIAAVLRILLHDTGMSHSLLFQLGLKDKLQFIDSLLPIDPQPVGRKNGVTTFVVQGLPGLIGITFVTKGVTKGGKFVAPLSVREGAKGQIPFSIWWENECIPGHDSKRYSRKQLILTMANKEGGSHVDTEIDNAYKQFAKSSLGFTFKVGGLETGSVNSAADVSVRQIAWEVLETLKQFPKKLSTSVIVETLTQDKV